MSRTIDNDRPEVNENPDLPEELDRIFALIHASPKGPRLCDLMAPGVTNDQIELCWLPAMQVDISPDGIVHVNVVEALRVLACDLLAAAKRIEEGSR